MGTDRIGRVFDSFSRLEVIHEAVLQIENTSGDFRYIREYAGKGPDAPFLAASITKMFTATCVLALERLGTLSLNYKVVEYFDDAELAGLLVIGGEDHTDKLTVSDLLFQVSGLPDAYEEGALKQRLLREDFHISFDGLLGEVRKLKAHSLPGASTKAHYADINYDILGRIVEKATGRGLSEAYGRYIFGPLGLKDTYLPEGANDTVPGVYYKDKLLHRPEFVKSSRASGGCVSTANDLMAFLKAFFTGELFGKDMLSDVSCFRSLQPSFNPIRYGGGLMQIPLSGIYTLFLGKGELIGHCGSTGSFAFYYPLKDLYFIGDLNQMADASLAVKLVMRLAMAVK